MSKTSSVEDQLQLMQEKLAFQEDLLEQLNRVVSDQSFEIQRLWDANRLLRQKIDESGGRAPEAHEPPPHY